MKSRISCFIKRRKKQIGWAYHLLGVFGAIVILPNFFLFLSRVLLVASNVAHMLYKSLKFIVDSYLIYKKKSPEDISMRYEQCRLYGIQNKKYLSELLHIDVYKLKSVKSHFTTTPFIKTSSSGKVRLLYNPSKEHKFALKALNRLLQKIVIPNYVYGGIKSKNYVQNAAVHKEKGFFLLLDLQDFFPSTKEIYIYNFFRYKLNMSKDIAKICTLLVTEEHPSRADRYLPQGYSTSPILSYLCYHDMFAELEEKSILNNVEFTCYYDDITFSSFNSIPKIFKDSVINIISKYDLIVHKKKTKLRAVRSGLKITGAIVKNHSLHAPNKLQHKLISNFNKLLELNLEDPSNKKELIKLSNVVLGCSSAIKSIEKTRRFPTIQNKIRSIRKSLNP